jgi:hypothetical protein
MSIVFVRNSNIFYSQAQCLVCPTNAVGAMGAGLARGFRDKIANLFEGYRSHCRGHEPNKLVPYVFDDRSLPHVVYCFHTKRHWREHSNLSIIQTGLDKLHDWCVEYELPSIAFPVLGCGLGDLKWKDVKPLMIAFSERLPDLEIEVYLPYGYE